MNRLWLAAFCLLALPVSALPQHSLPTQANHRSFGKTTGDHEQAAFDYSKESFIIEQYSTTARFENDGTGERDTAVRIRIQSDAAAEQLAKLTFAYNSANEKVDVRYVRVRKHDGTTVIAPPDAISDAEASTVHDTPAYSASREKDITVPALATGDELEYEIATQIVTPCASGEFWFEHNFIGGSILLDERLEISVPESRKVILDSPASPPDSIEHANGRMIYRWRRSHLSAPINDDSSNASTGDEKTKTPDVQLTTFTTWERVARWYASLSQGRAEPTPEIRSKVQDLTAGDASDIEKMRALYQYVSTNIRYVNLPFGSAGYQPHSAAEVFVNKYGDAKDENILLSAMLKAADLQPGAVLIAYKRNFDPSLPSPLQFDHVITTVAQRDDLIWMDSTTEVAPFRLLASPLRHKAALLVPPTGKGRVIETPTDPPFVSTQQVNIDGQVSDLGKFTGSAHYSVRGDTELVLRLAFHKTPASQWNDLAQTILTLDGIHGDVTSAKPSDPMDTDNPFELDIAFVQSNFLGWSAKSVKAPMPLLVPGLPSLPANSTTAIDLGSPLDVDVKLKLVLPSVYAAKPPPATSLSRDFAEFKSNYEFAAHTLIAERSLNFRIGEIPASRAGDYSAFTRAVAADENQPLVLEYTASGDPSVPATATTDELLEAGLAALNAGNAQSALPLFQRIVQLDPQHKQAWNDLGLAEFRIGKYEDAASAFRKQLEISPSDEHSNEYLGLALQQEQKYSEAADAFRKQIKANPLDAAAHAALGGILLEQHDYAQAALELDKATILSPENAALQVSLGSAYLNSDQKEKALAAFDKAAELSPTPAIWNDIAWNLADGKLELGKAQTYAAHAVSSTSAGLYGVDLTHLTRDQLQNVANIGAYWDTLGWVFFQEGDSASAERYIRAAWLLSQDGEIGDHLAQIYQKLGEKEKAVHTYALALATPHPLPESRAKLTILLGGNSQIDDLVKDARPELETMREISAGKLPAADAQARVLVLLSPTASGSRADAVQFVAGDERLRQFIGRLHSLDYGAIFPDASPIDLVLSGTIVCSANTGDCVLTLGRSEDILSTK